MIVNTSPGVGGIQKTGDGFNLVGPVDQPVPLVISKQATVLSSAAGLADEYVAAANQLANSSYSIPGLQFSDGYPTPEGVIGVSISGLDATGNYSAGLQDVDSGYTQVAAGGPGVIIFYPLTGIYSKIIPTSDPIGAARDMIGGTDGPYIPIPVLRLAAGEQPAPGEQPAQ